MAPGRTLIDDLRDALAQPSGDGRTQQQAMLQALIKKAIGGDTRAAHILIKLKSQGDAQPCAVDDATLDADAIDAEDKAVLEAFERQLREAQSDTATENAEPGLQLPQRLLPGFLQVAQVGVDPDRVVRTVDGEPVIRGGGAQLVVVRPEERALQVR